MFRRTGFSYGTVYYIVMLTLATQAVVGNLFTSVHDMETLAHQEERLLFTLTEYVSTQQARLNLLNTKLEQLLKVRPSWISTSSLIGDPINAFSLIRRLTREWPIILNLMVSSVDIQSELSLLPGEEDMQVALKSLVRLQEVYSLETTQMAKEGHLEGWGYADVTAKDCFEIGIHCYSEKKYDIAKSWFNAALAKIDNRDSTVEHDKVLTYLFLSTIYSECQSGIVSGSASNILHLLISQYPNYTLDKESSPLFKQVLYSSKCNSTNIHEVSPDLMDLNDTQTFSETCRGIGTYFSSDLRCFYIHYNNPRLLIAPFKMEELYLYPPLIMFHDVISDQEIKEMKYAFQDVRSRCETVKEDGYSKEENYYRKCDVGWVEDSSTDTSARLTRRVGDMTNLAMETSEINQVASYGLGGEFLLHYDPIPNESLDEDSFGSRIATLMFYMSDVENGGFTIFPRLNVAVTPKKGSAVFWFNLNHRSEDLPKMLHGGCPVLRGSKWVLNKWIHEGGQKSEMFCPRDEVFPKQRYYFNINN